MVSRIVLALALALSPAPILAADYAADPSLCRNGRLISDDPAGLSIGAGSVLMGGVRCDRLGPKVLLQDGWYSARRWVCQRGGQRISLPPFALRIVNREAQLMIEDRITTFRRCG